MWIMNFLLVLLFSVIFQVFCNDSYGKWDLPLSIPAEVFTEMSSIDNDLAALLTRCYQPLFSLGEVGWYTLRPMSGKHPGDLNSQEVTDEVLERLRNTLREKTNKEFQEKQLMSGRFSIVTQY